MRRDLYLIVLQITLHMNVLQELMDVHRVSCALSLQPGTNGKLLRADLC